MNTPLPKYLPGYPVKMGYMGLYRYDEQPTNRSGTPINLDSRILGVRWIPTINEDDEGVEFARWHGWEYQVYTHTDKGYREEGWYTEKELVSHGYPPSEDRLGGESELEMLRRLV